MIEQKKYANLSTLETLIDNIKSKFSQIGHKHVASDIEDIDEKISTYFTENPIGVEAHLNSDGILYFATDIIESGDGVEY